MSSSSSTIVCPTCGRCIDGKQYKITHYVIRTLLKIKELGYGQHKLSDYLSKSDMTNVTRLRAAGVLYKNSGSPIWSLTDYGIDFLEGKRTIPLIIYVDDNGKVLWEQGQVYIDYFLKNINFGRIIKSERTNQ